MALLTLYGEALELDEIRLALYGAAQARLSATGGASGGGLVSARSGAVTGQTPSGSIGNDTPSGKIGGAR